MTTLRWAWILIGGVALAFPALAAEMGAGAALAFSIRRGAANWGAVTLLATAIGIAALAVSSATAGLGSLLVTPWAVAVMTAAYLQVAGERERETA